MSGLLSKFVSNISVFHLSLLVFFHSLLAISIAQPPDKPTDEEIIFRSAQNLQQWGSINSFHGLPSEKINAIAQTNDGYLWFATDNGLARFDGRRVQTDLSQALSSFRVLDLKVDLDGGLWIATEMGAFYFIDDVFTTVSQTSGYSLISIAIDNSNNVYLAERNGLIFRANGKNLSTIVPIVKAALPIKSISSNNGELFIGTYNSGLKRASNGEIVGVETQPRPYFINVLASSSENKLWIGARAANSAGGLFVSENFPLLKSIGDSIGSVNSIAFAAEDERWIGTDTNGACEFKGETLKKCYTFENTSGGLRSNNVLATFVDHEGVVWFGTDKGVSRFDPRGVENKQISADVESNFVRALYQSKVGTVFAGTNRGLFRLNNNSEKWEPVRGIETNVVHSLADGTGGNILIATAGGAFELEPESLVNKKISNFDSRAIVNFRDEIYISSFRDGVTRGFGEGAQVITPDLVLAFLDADSLWLGTSENGLLSFDGSKTSSAPSISNTSKIAVRAIAGSEKDGIWFGTDRGIYRLKDNSVELIHNSNEVRNVVALKNGEGETEIWAGSAEGLIRLAFDKNFGWISSTIDVEEGLVSQNIFALLAQPDGKLLIGTNRGIVEYSRSEKKPILIANRIVSQRVHSSAEFKKGIELDYPQNSLSIDVSAISSRTFPEQFQYSFLLLDSLGQIQNKKLSGESQFVMENLTPGDYTVEVQAYDINLVKSAPMQFKVRVERAPFPWIIAVLGVFLLILFAALIWAITSQRKIARTSEQLAAANNELSAARLDLANEAERERRRISRDLHDQTLADLRHLMLMADEVSTEKAPEFRSEIENVSDEIRRICEDLSPSVLENIGFTAALEFALSSSIEQVAHEKEIITEFECELSIEAEEMLSRTDEIQIYRIAQEVLSNIVRHGDPTLIKMAVFSDSDMRFVLTIADNGQTFDPSKAKKGRGLTNVRARENLIEADVLWEEGEGGMIFTLKK